VLDKTGERNTLVCVKLNEDTAVDIVSRFWKQLEESEASDRNFGLMVGPAFVVIGLLRLLRAGQIRWAVGLGAVLILLAMLAPATLTRLKQAWLFLGFLLGLVVNPLVLSILFFAVITPAAVLLRLFGHDPLHRKMATDAKTYWQERSVSVSDMRMQF
jgi:predicted membrane protein